MDNISNSDHSNDDKSKLESVNAAKPESINSQPKFEDTLKPLGFYYKEISKELPKDYFDPTPSRLFVGIIFITLNILLINFVLTSNPNLLVKLLCGIAIGMMTGGCALLAHEVLHGSIVKGKNLQDALGFILFGPFLMSPTYWRFWHNNLHHGNTQLLYKDPDAFPTLGVYKRSKFMKWAFEFTPGSGTIRSYFYFFFWFSFQSFLNQIYMRFGNKMWDNMDHKRVTVEFTALIILATSYINMVGASNILWLVVIPFMGMNYTIMSYISTNHNLSPLTKINDPLANSLNVSNHPFFEMLHMNFGYHIEHHIFCNMSGRHTKDVSKVIQKMYPDKYKIMPKFEALKLLYSSSRIYKNKTELVHPKTGETFQTLGTKGFN